MGSAEPGPFSEFIDSLNATQPPEPTAPEHQPVEIDYSENPGGVVIETYEEAYPSPDTIQPL